MVYCVCLPSEWSLSKLYWQCVCWWVVCSMRKISGDVVCCSVVFGTLVGVSVFSGLGCWWHLLLVILCSHQCTSAREWSVRSHIRWGLSVCDVLYAVLYVSVNYFVIRGYAVSKMFINVCNSDEQLDMFDRQLR